MSRPLGKRLWRETTTAWREVVSAEDEATIMDWPVTSDYHEKQGRSTGRVVLGQGKLVIYLKRHWKLPAWRAPLAWAWPHGAWSPAAREWKQLLWARAQGFMVPEPLAMGQYVASGWRLQSYLALRELTGMLPLHQAIPEAYTRMPTAQFQRWKAKLLEKVATIARNLHAQHRYHKDLYLCHFYVQQPALQQSDPGDVALIDLHRLAHHRWWSRRWQTKDLAQLFFSMWGVAGLEGADRLLLFQHYQQQKTLNYAAQQLFLAAMRKAYRYARHNRIDTDIPATIAPQNQAA
ncbi:MAG TPA: lipopolysaccharide kinase InaA family protein [Gemmatales bacterium]|nr:lipopolysaccharide kinase InaA family protein [Gemmatales bacterium]